jgi:hypothetical protein
MQELRKYITPGQHLRKTLEKREKMNQNEALMKREDETRRSSKEFNVYWILECLGMGIIIL